MKIENEITVKILCSYDELTEKLQQKGFEVARSVRLHDTYYVKNDLNVKDTPNDIILSNYLIIRVPHDDVPVITYKYKEFNPDGSIKRQGKLDCDIHNAEDGYQLLELMGYKKLIVIDNEIKFYEKDNIRLVAAQVNNEYICLEYSDEAQSIDELIAQFNAEYDDIPFDKTNYFINKAFIELDKIKN